VALQVEAGGPGDPLLLARQERLEGHGPRGAVLDLDEQDELAAPGDEVDLAERRGEAPGEDAKALEPQEPGGQGLGQPAGALAALPAHGRSRARVKARR
jgi:hypothetical protein